MIVRLGRVKEHSQEYKSVARKNVGDFFNITKAKINERGIFEKINSDLVLQTSNIKNIEIGEDLIIITTKNSTYYFEVI